MTGVAAIDRPRVFIGSATESVHVAEALQAVLQGVAEVTLWPDAFNIGEYSIDDLRDAAKVHDFAVFVFTPDDEVTSRGTTSHAPRDNVLFELGLFSSRLGPRHTFVLKPERESLKVPSDLAGITFAMYRAPDAPPDDARWESAVRPAARKIRRSIERARQSELAPTVSGDAVANAHASRPSAAELLASELMAAARGQRLPAVTGVQRGLLVVHAVLGIGQVVGYDPPGVPDRAIRVRFPSGVALVDEAELSQPVLPGGATDAT